MCLERFLPEVRDSGHTFASALSESYIAKNGKYYVDKKISLSECMYRHVHLSIVSK